MSEFQEWFEEFRKSKNYNFFKQKPIAYFSIEYALTDLIPTYAGGLGVLAGDYVRELNDQNIPAVAVGLFYQNKYGVQDIPHQKPNYVPLSPEEQGLKQVVDENKKSIIIEIPIQDHIVFAKAWVWEHNSIPVYLLDTDVEENSHIDRQIVYQLYDGDKEIRLKQEIILGIGGFRLLEKLNIKPSIYHMNEGHSSMLYLEIIRHEMQKRKISFKDAVALSTHHVVFTNHTLVSSGNEIFSNDLFTFLLNKYASELEVPVTDILELGTIQESNSFSMTVLSLRLAGKINAVSQLHAIEAEKSWANYKVDSVTNGIYIPTWDKILENDVVTSHKNNKKIFLEYIKKVTGQVWGENDLVIGWARRMVRYKRPLTILGDINRLKQLSTQETPIKIVMAGIAHQSDDEGRLMVQQIKDIMGKELSGSAVFLDEYNTTVSALLVSGSDLWLNTPVIGSEACGTSGMKAALNGTPSLSTKDGWVYEVDISKLGWDIDGDNVEKSVLDVLQYDILPKYYSTDKSKWESVMQSSRELILSRFSTTRMLKEYFEKLYIPTLEMSYKHYLS